MEVKHWTQEKLKNVLMSLAQTYILVHNLWKSDKQKQVRRNMIAPCSNLDNETETILHSKESIEEKFLHKELITKATRQKLDAIQKKHRIEVRLSDYDLDILDDTCDKLNFTRSQVLRGGIHDMNNVTITEVKTIHNVSLEKLASECKALGIHVNQIAKSLNTRQVNYKYMDNDEFLTTFQAVKCVPEITSKVSELIEKIEASRKDFIVDVDAEVEKGIDNYVYGQRALTDRYQEENNYGND